MSNSFIGVRICNTHTGELVCDGESQFTPPDSMVLRHSQPLSQDRVAVECRTKHGAVWFVIRVAEQSVSESGCYVTTGKVVSVDLPSCLQSR